MTAASAASDGRVERVLEVGSTDGVDRRRAVAAGGLGEGLGVGREDDGGEVPPLRLGDLPAAGEHLERGARGRAARDGDVGENRGHGVGDRVWTIG